MAPADQQTISGRTGLRPQRSLQVPSPCRLSSRQSLRREPGRPRRRALRRQPPRSSRTPHRRRRRQQQSQLRRELTKPQLPSLCRARWCGAPSLAPLPSALSSSHASARRPASPNVPMRAARAPRRSLRLRPRRRLAPRDVAREPPAVDRRDRLRAALRRRLGRRAGQVQLLQAQMCAAPPAAPHGLALLVMA